MRWVLYVALIGEMSIDLRLVNLKDGKGRQGGKV